MGCHGCLRDFRAVLFLQIRVKRDRASQRMKGLPAEWSLDQEQQLPRWVSAQAVHMGAGTLGCRLGYRIGLGDYEGWVRTRRLSAQESSDLLLRCPSGDNAMLLVEIAVRAGTPSLRHIATNLAGPTQKTCFASSLACLGRKDFPWKIWSRRGFCVGFDRIHVGLTSFLRSWLMVYFLQCFVL